MGVDKEMCGFYKEEEMKNKSMRNMKKKERVF